jgi:beta-xylosidase
MKTSKNLLVLAMGAALFTVGCSDNNTASSNSSATVSSQDTNSEITSSGTDKFIGKPLVNHIYTADPSAHVFNGRIYIYPSHDIDSGITSDGEGDKFDMKDYHVLSLDKIGGEVIDHGAVLKLEDIPWASRQLWAPDATEKDGRYFLFFPAKDKDGIFRIGVATSDSPSGPFAAEPEPIKGSFSIDPTVFKDDDGSQYLYFGGIWGGQLQRWASGEYRTEDKYPASNEPALSPKVARLSDDLLQFSEAPRDVQILDNTGNPLLGSDANRRFFEGAWLHKFNGKYYFSYSTGDTHYIAYATGDSPYGPFTHQGIVLMPVLGWTTHHSIVEVDGKWFLFYHDSELSGGKTYLRNIKATELTHNDDGTIQTIVSYSN